MPGGIVRVTADGTVLREELTVEETDAFLRWGMEQFHDESLPDCITVGAEVLALLKKATARA